MATSVTDTLTGWVRTIFQISRVNGQDVGSVSASQNYAKSYEIGDGATAGNADLVFSDTRTIPANTSEVLDLLDLTQQTFGVAVPFVFNQVRMIRVLNNETVAGRRVLIGSAPGNPTGVYAASVGPASEWHAINYSDSWVVTSGNRNLQITNPNAVQISYTIFILGTSTVAGA